MFSCLFCLLLWSCSTQSHSLSRVTLLLGSDPGGDSCREKPAPWLCRWGTCDVVFTVTLVSVFTGEAGLMEMKCPRLWPNIWFSTTFVVIPPPIPRPLSSSLGLPPSVTAGVFLWSLLHYTSVNFCPLSQFFFVFVVSVLPGCFVDVVVVKRKLIPRHFSNKHSIFGNHAKNITTDIEYISTICPSALIHSLFKQLNGVLRSELSACSFICSHSKFELFGSLLFLSAAADLYWMFSWWFNKFVLQKWSQTPAEHELKKQDYK